MKTFEVFLIEKKGEGSGKYYFEKQIRYLGILIWQNWQLSRQNVIWILTILRLAANE